MGLLLLFSVMCCASCTTTPTEQLVTVHDDVDIPDGMFICDAKPIAPITTSQKDVALYLLKLNSAYDSCNDALLDLKDLYGTKNIIQGK